MKDVSFEFRKSMLRFIIFLIFLAIPAVSYAEKVKLSILMYPWVPNYDYISSVIKAEFENKKENENIELVISEQNWDYYNPGGLNKEYDLYELDTVFLPDFISSGRIQEIDKNKITRFDNSFNFAKTASQWQDKTFGIPHWVCGLFLFYYSHDSLISNSNTMGDLITAIGVNHERNRGLLIDMFGNYTLAELYLDDLLDLGYKSDEIIGILGSNKLNKDAVKSLSETTSLIDAGLGRDILTHKAWPPYYAHEFAHGRGRALVGYSEHMYHILNEINQPTDMMSVINPTSITIKMFNQGNSKGFPLAWVDSFVLNSNLTGEKLKAAYAFLNFITSDEIFIKILLPPGQVPQYLLPSYVTTYTEKELLQKAPIYEKFYSQIKDATNIKGDNFPALLESAGESLNKELPKNLYRRN